MLPADKIFDLAPAASHEPSCLQNRVPSAAAFDWEGWFFEVLAHGGTPQDGGALRLPACPRVFVPELRALEHAFPQVLTTRWAPAPHGSLLQNDQASDLSQGLPTDLPQNLAEPGMPPGEEQAEVLSLDFSEEVLGQAARVAAALQLSAAHREGLTPALSTEALDACVQVLNDVQAPYYLRYLLVRNALQDPERFAGYQARLETPSIKLHRGNSQHHRFDALERHFPGGHVLVDIGCGKATYLKTLAKRYRRATGFDADPYARAMATLELQTAGLTNVRVFGAFDAERYVPDHAHVLMTEVLEHLPQERACELLRHLSEQNAEKMVFTVPNRDFNPHYGMPPGAFRHWDHQWEPNTQEFEDVMRTHLDPKKWSLHFEPVGDAVQGVASGSLCVAKRLPAPTAAKSVPRSWLEGVLR